MPHVLVHQRIREFDRWKEMVDRLGPARAEASSVLDAGEDR